MICANGLNVDFIARRESEEDVSGWVVTDTADTPETNCRAFGKSLQLGWVERCISGDDNDNTALLLVFGRVDLLLDV